MECCFYLPELNHADTGAPESVGEPGMPLAFLSAAEM